MVFSIKTKERDFFNFYQLPFQTGLVYTNLFLVYLTVNRLPTLWTQNKLEGLLGPLKIKISKIQSILWQDLKFFDEYC